MIPISLPQDRAFLVDNKGLTTPPYYRWMSDGTRAIKELQTAVTALQEAISGEGSDPVEAAVYSVVQGAGIKVSGAGTQESPWVISLRSVENSGTGTGLYKITVDTYGRVSGYEDATLDDLIDVDAATPSDGDVLTWVDADSEWQAVPIVVTASDVGITDTGGYFTGTDVEAALQELGAAKPIGKHAIWMPAGAMAPSATGGCAALATIASAANQPDIQTLNFDATTAEYAQFSLRMPKSWDEGTITFVPVWSHAATTTNFGVVWALQAVAVSDDDTIAASYGTAQNSADTGGTTNDIYAGPESSAITIAGSPAAQDVVFFRIARLPSDGSDTMAIDARLHGVTVYFTTNASNDA